MARAHDPQRQAPDIKASAVEISVLAIDRVLTTPEENVDSIQGAWRRMGESSRSSSAS